MGKTTWTNFQASLKKTAKYVEKNKIKYNNSFRSTYAGIKKSGVNCTAYVSISMRDAGLTKKAYNFYCKDGKLKGSETAPLKKHFDVKQEINKSLATCVKNGTVKVGDIVGAASGAHTMVYRGKINGKYTFYSLGKSALTEKKICNNTRAGSYKVGVRIRPTYIKAVTTTTKTSTAASVSTNASKYTVGIYRGHGISLDGSKDVGCTYKVNGTTYTEAGLVDPIVTAACAYLKGSGVNYLTDVGNKINMKKQVAEVNAKKCDLYITVHTDYYKAPAGTLPLYVSSKGKALATDMNKHVMKYTGCKTRGLGYRSDLYDLTASDMPACVFEAGSIKNDLSRMQSKADLYGKGIAAGICEYLGVTFTGKKG